MSQKVKRVLWRRWLPPQNPLQGADELLAAGDGQVDGDRDDGGDDGQGPTDPVDAGGLSDAEESGNRASDECAHGAQHDGPQDRDVLLATHDESGEGAEHGAGDDHSDE